MTYDDAGWDASQWLRDAPRRPFTEKEKRTLSTLHEALQTFILIRHTMPLQYVRTFLEVAMDEGRSVNEYAKRLKVSKSVMSRQLLDIGPRTRNASTGFGLIVTQPNVHERRRHEVYLSPKGRALAQHLKRTLNQED